MNYIKPFTFTNLNDIQQDINIYVEELTKTGVVVFRNAHLNDSEQNLLQTFFGAALNFYPNQLSDDFDFYIENHQLRPNIKKTSKEENLIEWHIESPFYDNPIVIGVWNMKLFDLPQGHGNTWFVDTIPIIEALDKDDHDFLQQCMIEFPWHSIPQEGANVLKTENIKLLQPVVQPHWLTNKSVPRCFFNYNPDGEWLETPLVSVSDRKPTEEEVIKFKRILAYIINETKKSDNLLIHQWQEGDVLIADLHKLAHTVKGGIDPDKREFRGLWGYWKNWNINPRIDIEKRIKLKNETY